MLAAWARGTDGILFPLYRSTAVNLTFEESVNKHHSFGSCWCARASITEQTLLQNTRSFSGEKNSLNSFGSCESNIFQYVGGEYSILLIWKPGVHLVF